MTETEKLALRRLLVDLKPLQSALYSLAQGDGRTSVVCYAHAAWTTLCNFETAAEEALKK